MKKFLSLVLALVMAMSLVTVSAGAKDFTDSDSISGEDYAEAIDVMSALEIIDGYEGGAFQPQGTLTRGAAAKIIACMMLGKTTAESLGSQAAPFKDVPAGSTFAGYIAYCVEAGIIDGYADGTFRPSNKLTGFAFLKMLLTAMGYDSAVEHFTGTNWTVNVARRAIENGLTDGNDNFVGTDLATREEACLYAVNTIQATLVEYENKGSSITINGVEISQGASAPKVVTSVNKEQATSINGEKYITGATGQQDTYTVEFGEKYMPKLSLKGDTDSFMRPSHIWNYKGVEIGEYTDEADLTYTKKVTSNDIYDDLGLTEAVVAATYEDGVAPGTFTVKNNDVNNKIGGKGVLTQVFKSGHWEAGKWVTDVTITLVNTYVGDVVSKTAATSVKDAYVTVVARENARTTYPSGNFTTDDFAVDDVVVYNYSYKTGEAGVKNLAVAETTTGTLTAFTTGDSATVGGTKYDYAVKYAREAGVTSVNTDVTVVLDPYGYAIDIDAADATYAVVLKAVNAGLRPEATLLFTDGTVKDVVLASPYTYANAMEGDIVTYTIKSNDKYSLTLAKNGTAYNEKSSADAVTATIENGKYNFTTGNGAYTANGKTIFLVRNVDANGNAMYSAYEGIKNAPSITKTITTDRPVSVYCKTGNLATVVFVDARGSEVLNPASDVAFLKGNNDADSYTTGIGSYHKYTAVVNGELKDEFMTVALGGGSSNQVVKDTYDLFDEVYYDTNGVATLRKSGNVIAGVGVYQEDNSVLGTYDVTMTGSTPDATPNNYAYYPVSSSCYVVLVDEDGTITTGLPVSAVVKDTDDLVWFKRSASGEITSAYIVKVTAADKYALNGVAGSAFYATKANAQAMTSPVTSIEAGKTVYVVAPANYTLGSSTLTAWTNEGKTNDGTQNIYSFLMPIRAVVAGDFTATLAATNMELNGTTNTPFAFSYYNPTGVAYTLQPQDVVALLGQMGASNVSVTNDGAFKYSFSFGGVNYTGIDVAANATQVYAVTYSTEKVTIDGVEFQIIGANNTYAAKNTAVTLTIAAKGTVLAGSDDANITAAKAAYATTGTAAAVGTPSVGTTQADGTGTAVATGLTPAAGKFTTGSTGGAVDARYTVTITIDNTAPCDTVVTIAE